MDVFPLLIPRPRLSNYFIHSYCVLRARLYHEFMALLLGRPSPLVIAAVSAVARRRHTIHPRPLAKNAWQCMI